jgi:type I restriction enzyme, S subunit
VLRDIALINPRSREDRTARTRVTFVRMPDISEASWRFRAAEVRPWAEVSKGFTPFSDGDVLFAKITPCMENGKAAVAVGLENGCGAGTTELHVIRPLGGISPFYLYHYLHQESYRRRAAGSMTGAVGQARVPVAFVEETEIPLPPLAEQPRIVGKLEEALGKVDASKQRLEKVAVSLKRFRRAVLAAACSGRLTEDFNGGYGGELPESWRFAPVEELIADGGLFDGPFGSSLKSSDYVESGVRVIRLENIGHLRFVGEKRTFISSEKYASLKRHTVGGGDIIFSSFIDEEIRACILPALSTKAIAKADCFCIRPDESRVDPRYLVLQLVSRESYDALLDEVHGVTRPRINTRQLRKLRVRVCPVPEQRAIVARVEALYKLVDQVEARYIAATETMEQLTQSILAKAFSGELVPQNPKDEPATALLERILANRGTRSNAGKGVAIKG